MAERVWCFEPGDRLMTMGAKGVARVWEVSPDGWLHLVQGPPAARLWEAVTPATDTEPGKERDQQTYFGVVEQQGHDREVEQ